MMLSLSLFVCSSLVGLCVRLSPFLGAKAPLGPLDVKIKVKVKVKVKVKAKKLRNSMILPKFIDDG